MITMPDGTSRKQQIRDRARVEREKLAPAEIDRKSRAIGNSVRTILNGEDGVMLYASKDPEVNTRPLMETLLSEGVRVVVPVIVKETCSLRLSYIDDLSVLVTSTFSVPEPIGNEIPARCEDIGTVVVPMVAFDRAGHRLGYGAGYYDRFLFANRGMKKIGVAFSCQEVSSVPADANDIAMDIIVTEDEVIRCRCPQGGGTPGSPGGR